MQHIHASSGNLAGTGTCTAWPALRSYGFSAQVVGVEVGLVDDGSFQDGGVLEACDDVDLIRLPYAGNGVLASAVGMDKHFTKTVLQAAGVPWPRGAHRRAAVVLGGYQQQRP